MIKKTALLVSFALFCFGAILPIRSDFKACFKRSKNSFVRVKKRDFIAVGKHKALIFSRYRIKDYIKRDPFLGLYLIKTKQSLTPISFTSFNQASNSKIVAVVNKKDYKLASIISADNALNYFARLSKDAKPNSLVECVCCREFGLSTGGKSFIDSDFILRFLKNKTVFYADSGLRFAQKGKKIYVKALNPFFQHFKIRVGDKIVSINGKTFSTVSSLNKFILFSKLNRVLTIKYRRYGRVFVQKIRLKRRISGGLLGESFFEYIGLYVRRDLRVSYVRKGSLAYKLGIKKGDKLMKIDDDFVKSFSHIKPLLSRLHKDEVYLLLERNGFQFFVHFRR